MKALLIVILMSMCGLPVFTQSSSQYFDKYRDVAKILGNRYDICPDSILAIGDRNTNSGTNDFAKINNHFKIKCFSTRCKKGHCTNFKGNVHKDFYRIYWNVFDCMEVFCIMNRGNSIYSRKK